MQCPRDAAHCLVAEQPCALADGQMARMRIRIHHGQQRNLVAFRRQPSRHFEHDLVGGEIAVELLSYREDGDTAVALFRQHEIERYYGQTIHASYLLSTVWKKRADGWRQIEGQVLAERTDPPSIALPASDLQKFAGTYKLKDSEPTYTITLTDGKLMGSRTGKASSEWDAETRDVFFIKGDPRIRKIFQYDAVGRVTGFIERRESWDIVWNKAG